MGAYLVETFVTLAAVCALAVVVLWGARRLGVGRPTGPIELCGHLPLDARRAIYLIRVGEQLFVVGVGEGGFTKLGELAAADLPMGVGSGSSVGPGERGATFSAVLAQALKGRDKT
jgi:flagellar biogenesis protein FliO